MRHSATAEIVPAARPAKWNAQRMCRVYLDSIVQDKLNKEGIKADGTVILADRAGDGIVDHSGQHPSALIVVSTHGHCGFSRLPYGHVADRILLASTNPVLLVRPRKP